MYVSREVRAIRDNPTDGESVTLRVTAPDAVDDVRDAITLLENGCIDSVGRFDTLVVTVAQAEVEAVCSIAGVTVVETDAVLGVGTGDAGEDIDPE